ncbi:MAG TPA: TolC family protein, partial [Pirellulaceae bacterium]|nr:TolC family protein [Pirellulaceae bacterium]
MKPDRKMTPNQWRICGLLMLALLSGCSLPRASCSHAPIGEEMMARTSHTVMCVGPAEFVVPPDVVFEDGVSEDEAVATALSNNAAFQSMLAQLGMAEGDLIQAGLLTNPNLGTFLPISAKQWEWTLFVPLEAFVLRPHRLAIADSDYERVANGLVQNGLTLVRDVRVAHADLAVAIAQYQLAQEIINIRQGISDLTQKRLDHGDISELEAMTARVDVLNAEANAGLLEQNVVVARSRLAWLMGMPPTEAPLFAVLAPPPPLPELDVALLIDESFALRPDARAADWAVAAADERLRVARLAFLRIDGVVDANQRGLKGYEVGPGIR